MSMPTVHKVRKWGSNLLELELQTVAVYFGGARNRTQESEQLLLNTGPSFQYPGQFCLFYLNYKFFIFTNHLQVNYYLVNVNMSLLCQTFLNFSIHKFTTYFPFDLSWSLIIIFPFLDNYSILKQLFCIKPWFYSVVLDKNIRFFGLQIMNWQDFIFASLWSLLLLLLWESVAAMRVSWYNPGCLAWNSLCRSD